MHETRMRSPGLGELAGTDGVAVTVAAGRDRANGEAPRILIVEDDTLISIDIECMLEGLGYRVAGTASRIHVAMDFLNKQDEMIDCAILDVQVGGHTCLPIAQALDDLGVPYLFITGHDKETVRKLGLTGDVIQKPFLDRHLDTHLSALVASS